MNREVTDIHYPIKQSDSLSAVCRGAQANILSWNKNKITCAKCKKILEQQDNSETSNTVELYTLG